MLTIARRPVAAQVTPPLAAMLGLYVLIDFVLRILSRALFDTELAPFTPSRFLTDAVSLPAVLAGIFFRSMHGDRDSRSVPLVATVLAVLRVQRAHVPDAADVVRVSAADLRVLGPRAQSRATAARRRW